MIDIADRLSQSLSIEYEEAQRLAESSEAEARLYLGYAESDDITRFSSAVYTLALLTYQKEQAEAQAQAADTQGVKSESFSEGGVSVKKDYETASETSSLYAAKITQYLTDTLSRYRRGTVYPTSKASKKK